MTILYITSDQTQSGKTSLASALARHMLDNDHTVAVVKAITSDEKSDTDTLVYGQLLNQNIATKLPIHIPAAQLDESLPNETITQICEEITLLEEKYPLVIVEGLSSIDSQSKEGQNSVNLAQQLGAQVLVVAKFRSDFLHSELNPCHQLFGDQLLGIIINRVTRYKEEHVQSLLVPQLQQAKIPVLGWIPEDRILLGVSVKEIANHLEGQFLNNEEDADKLVEHFLIGVLVLDSGVTYFERLHNKAVVVRGNRPDIQMAALRTPTACIVLTGGDEPIQYIQHEAEEENVPLIKTSYSTLEVTSKLDDLMTNVRFNHPKKLAQIKSLVNQYLDMAMLSKNLTK
jgi:BioD-like phosphotransacetylase family protein